MELALTFVMFVLAGLCVGILSGMLGIGGGMIMVPLFRLGFGFSAYIATATSLFAIIPTSISGTAQHIRNKTCIPKLGLALGIGGAITSSLGVYLASFSPSWLIMVVAAVVIIYSAYTMLRKAIKMGKKRDALARAAQLKTAASVPPEFELTRNKLLGGLGIGLIAGLFSGYVGVGGGFIMVPLMTAWLAVPMKKASGTSLIAIMILAVPGVIGQMLLGHVDYMAGIMICIGAIPGAVLGAKLVPHIPERALRFVFAGVLALAGISLVLNELGVL